MNNLNPCSSSPVIDVLRTETTRQKELDIVQRIQNSAVFEPRLKNRKILTSPVNDIFESDILPRLNNDFSNWT